MARMAVVTPPPRGSQSSTAGVCGATGVKAVAGGSTVPWPVCGALHRSVRSGPPPRAGGMRGESGGGGGSKAPVNKFGTISE